MLRFFRNIRQSLIMPDNIRKYLLYGLGEILLVVMGILIALQINNWNEEQKIKADEVELLRSLKSDFDSRLIELKYIIAGKKKAMTVIDLVIQDLDNGTISYSPIEMDSLLAIYSVSYNFNEKFSALDMLFNSGRINSISNTELRDELILWPSLLEEMLEEQRLVSRNDQLVTAKFNSKISLRNMVRFVDFNDYDLKYRPNKEPNNYEFMIGDKEIENILFNRYNLFYWNTIDGQKLIVKAERIIELIETEVAD